jgi:hypothetical protein
MRFPREAFVAPRPPGLGAKLSLGQRKLNLEATKPFQNPLFPRREITMALAVPLNLEEKMTRRRARVLGSPPPSKRSRWVPCATCVCVDNGAVVGVQTQVFLGIWLFFNSPKKRLLMGRDEGISLEARLH